MVLEGCVEVVEDQKLCFVIWNAAFERHFRDADATGDDRKRPWRMETTPLWTFQTQMVEGDQRRMVLEEQKILQSDRDKIQGQGAIVDKLAKLCKEQEEIIKKQNENIEKLTRLRQEQVHSTQLGPNLTKEEIEAVVEAKFVSVIETKPATVVGSPLTKLVEPKSTSIVDLRLEAIVAAKLETGTIHTGNMCTMLRRIMDAHKAQINKLKRPLTS
ncbi:hypothetical protein HPB50_016467 [Hyalomma asiaticum]|uniref:Uncharacterized protein n=1 Tax=Hyalomma asiaticum TaxID=266040 RepID=A0ACB7RPH8_HYAAI|nr:hypothetical protein HPB50_016467 [Hyalomma asiaticum]